VKYTQTADPIIRNMWEAHDLTTGVVGSNTAWGLSSISPCSVIFLNFILTRSFSNYTLYSVAERKTSE
jgi:hypothetical protein